MIRHLVLILTVTLLAFAAHAAELPEPVVDEDYRDYSPAQVKLGQLLFYDRVLSGTYRVSCATCHNHDRASSNGFRLDRRAEPAGDELAVNGLPIYDALKPSSRHAPALFNLGAKEFQSLFSDGRVARSEDGTFTSPAGSDLPLGLRDVLAVQALFPAVTDDELVGTVDNDVAAVAHRGNRAVWDVLAARVRDLPDYLPVFQRAFDDVKSSADITIVHIADAISAFVGTEWRSDASAFDAYLRGDADALTRQQERGLALFYGKANCATCHAGKFQTDHSYHAIAMPPWRFDTLFGDDLLDIRVGRSAVSGREDERYKMRTPSLRNVALTPPYGHSGAFETLEEVVRHHLGPVDSLSHFLERRERDKAIPAGALKIAGELKQATSLPSIDLNNREIMDLISFLEALSDEHGATGRLGKPANVPSSLALD